VDLSVDEHLYRTFSVAEIAENVQGDLVQHFQWQIGPHREEFIGQHLAVRRMILKLQAG